MQYRYKVGMRFLTALVFKNTNKYCQPFPVLECILLFEENNEFFPSYQNNMHGYGWKYAFVVCRFVLITIVARISGLFAYYIYLQFHIKTILQN